MKTKNISWNEVMKGCRNIADKIKLNKPKVIIGVSRGGCVIATILSHMLGCEMGVVSCKRYQHRKNFSVKNTGKDAVWVNDVKLDTDEIFTYETPWSNKRIAFHRAFSKDEAILVVDDIIDDGVTMKFTLDWLKKTLPRNQVEHVTLYSKIPCSSAVIYEFISKNTWVKFPWE